jgi:hypothetical protein
MSLLFMRKRILFQLVRKSAEVEKGLSRSSEDQYSLKWPGCPENENKIRKSYEVEKEIYTLDSIALLGILGREIPKPIVKLSHSLIGAADGADEVLATRLHCVKDTDLDLIHRKAQAILMLEVLKEVVQVALELLIVEMRDGEGVLICCQETIWTTELDTISRAHNAGVI